MMMKTFRVAVCCVALANVLVCATAVFAQLNQSSAYDFIIKNGRIIDGSGNPWVSGDIAISDDRIAKIGKLENSSAKRVIDAHGLIVAPGFIDMLGQSETALLIDNRSLSKLSQGITSEITGEGGSIAPQNALTISQLQPELDRYHLTIDWTTLDGYFSRLEKSGTPLNIGTYVGAAQVREAVLGDVGRAPTPEELEKMKALVAEAMQQGAFGISTALIYPPGQYAKTAELIELAKVAAQYGGIYGTHMRSEGQSEIAAISEALRIGRDAHLPVEIFHLKVIGKSRWGTMPKIVGMIQAARDAGQDVSANMYPYVAGGTALASSLPPWVADGGLAKLLERIKDPAVRIKIKQELSTEHSDWENLYLGSLDGSELSLDGPLFDPHTHPRAFGSMPRFLGHYVRDEHLLSWEQAIRKVTSLPAQRECLRDRGLLKEGFFADITVLDPATMIDNATYQNPAQISQGVKYVFVNGKLEYEDGKLTGVNAGRALRGPGWTGHE